MTLEIENYKLVDALSACLVVEYKTLDAVSGFCFMNMVVNRRQTTDASNLFIFKKVFKITIYLSISMQSLLQIAIYFLKS